MPRIKLPKEALDPEDERVISILRLLGSLEYALTTQKWYMRYTSGDQKMPPHEGVECLVVACTYIAAALETYRLVSKILNVIGMDKSDWPVESKKSLAFLESKQVRGFQENQLKRVRDKCAFHFDPEPARDLCVAAQSGVFDEDDSDVSTIYQETGGPITGHYPIAGLMVARWFVGQPPEDKNISRNRVKWQAEMAQDIIQALHHVTACLVPEVFHDAVRE
jgi:hypothetical protein